MSVSKMIQEGSPEGIIFPDYLPIIKKFEGKPSIPGILGNFQFYAHEKEATYSKKSFSYTSLEVKHFENDLVLGLCRHLLFNNVRIEQFKVMCNSENRVRQLELHFESVGPKAYREIEVRLVGDKPVNIPGNHVSILLLVPTGGDNEEDNFVKSVLQTVKNSRNGIIIIASFHVLSAASTTRWANLLKSMNELKYINPSIMIHCSKHNKVCRRILSNQDLKMASPLGGCLELCRIMACGHPCDSVCHPTFSAHHGETSCNEPCTMRCPAGHPCKMECHQLCACAEGCPFLRECGHPQNNKRDCDSLCWAKLPCGKHLCLAKCGECLEDPNHEKTICSEICENNCASDRHPCRSHLCHEGCPPCQIKVTHELRECKHKVVLPCCEPFDEFEYFCRQPCEKRYGVCGHPCLKLCGEECGICEVVSKRPHPICGHKTNALCNTPITEPCKAYVYTEVIPPCGHENVRVPCKIAKTITPDMLADYCRKKCDRLLNDHDGDCGHYCFGNCFECNNGKMHIRCETPCGKKLFCGHSCKVSCPMLCPPCIETCMSTCEHAACPYECGVPCENICQEPCPYSCPHLTCTQVCGAVCDRPGCFQPCPKTLDCGHECVGFCGELCPHGCRICSPHLLTNFLGLSGEEVSRARFITIRPCGHSVEEGDLTQWMNVRDERREIKYKCCPACLEPIEITLRRYSPQIREAWTGVQEIKRKIIGNELEIGDRLEKIKTFLKTVLGMDEGSKPLTRFLKHGKALLDEANQPIKKANHNGCNFESMHLDKVKFIQWAIDQWVKAEKICTQYDHIWKSGYVRKLETGFEEVFSLMMSGYWPLHPNEVNSVVAEMDRVTDAERLYDRLSLINDEQMLILGNSREGKIRFKRAEDILRETGSYSSERKAEFKEKFEEFCVVQNYTLNISDQERVAIVQAFGTQAGRWFKCPNGHVYVVTECGGMTEMSQCNECGAPIGGEQHKLLKFNQLASEMDGAEGSLWPTALDP